MANVLGCRCLIVGHDPQPRGQRLKHYIAKGFGQARKQKYIPRRIVTGQGFTALSAAENRLGQFVLQFLALRTIADHDQLQGALWITGLEGVEGALEQSQVFFLGQATDMNDRDVFFGQSPLLAQGVQAFGGVKQLTVDPSGKQRQALEVTPFQLHSLTDAGHQGHGRTIVEPAQVVGQQPRQQAEPILVGVLLEIGVKAADHRYPQAPCRSQCR